MNQNELLRQRFNSMSPEMFQGYINNPRTGSQLKAWMKANNYQHPGMMQSSAVSPAVSAPVTPVTSNLGMNGPTMQNAYPTAPDTGFKGYPYAGDVTPEQFTFQPSDVATGRTTAYGSGLPQYTSSGMVDPTFSPSASASAQQASDQAVADSISGADAGGMSNLQSAGMYYGANVATDALINTHDRKKVDTPLGNKGSQGGIVKGGIKGALLGAQLSGGNPYVTAGSALVGA